MSSLNITKRSNGWQYRFEGASVDGKRKQFSKSGFKTKKDALEAGTKALAEYNQSGVYRKASDISFSDFLHYFIDHGMSHYKDTTQKIYRVNILYKIIPAIGHYKVSSLTPTILSDFLVELKGKNYSLSTITTVRSVLTASLTYAVEPMHYLQSNPMLYVKTPNVDRKTESRTPITTEQWKRIMEMFPEGNRYHLPLMLGYYCGLRIGECYGLQWEDVDFENNMLHVERQLVMTGNYRYAPPKQNSSRVIKFGSTLKEELLREKERQEKNREYYGKFWCRTGLVNGSIRSTYNLGECEKEVHPLIVEESGKMLWFHGFVYCTKKIRKELGIDFDYHTLRHTHATMLIESGANIKAVQTRLGHKNIRTTLNVYTHTTQSMEDEAVEIFEKITS